MSKALVNDESNAAVLELLFHNRMVVLACFQLGLFHQIGLHKVVELFRRFGGRERYVEAVRELELALYGLAP